MSHNPPKIKTSQKVDFSTFDKCRVAIIIEGADAPLIFKGEAVFLVDDQLGRALRILVESAQPGNPEIMLEEKAWAGRIIPDVKYSCDYCFIPGKRSRR